MSGRKAWEAMRDDRLERASVRKGYERAQRAFELGDQVRRLREAQDMTQAELARMIGSTQPAVARLEAGGVTPSIPTLERIAAALGLELSVRFKRPA